MGSNSNSAGEDVDGPHHAIQIWEVNQDRLSLMHRKIAATPGILRKSAGRSSCCIFRVPKSLNDINGEHYQPRVLSIGPYHHGKPQLAMIEEHKWRFLGILLNRTEAKGLKLEDYLKAVQPLESRARDCYSESFRFNPDEFVEMLVVDGCFIIELFRKFGGIIETDSDDPLFNMSWVYSFFLRDLIRLENQIPFFILQTLFELTRMPDEKPGRSLAYLTLKFFDNAVERSEEFIENYRPVEGKHILDILRASFIPPGFAPPKPGKFSRIKVIQCITNLRRAGISIQPGKDLESFLAITFKHGVLEMPTIALDDFMSSFLLNCVAYEQCHGACSKHMTTYITLIDCLMNTSRDVTFLCDQNIIENYFGTDAEIAKFVNNMGKDVSLDLDSCYLAGLFDEVNRYYNSPWHTQVATFKNTYFSTPWSFISAMAAFVLLVLTILQTIYTMLGYVKGQ